MSDLICAATAWPTNAALIADVAVMYLDKNACTLDPTWGKGKWWTLWKPNDLTRHDRYTLDGSDFRDLPHDDGSFDQIGYDPPYVCPGGLKTSTTKAMHSAYGMDSGGVSLEEARDFKTPAQLQTIMDDGLTEMRRLVAARGKVLMKCKDYIWGGKLWEGTYRTRKHAEALGFTVLDRVRAHRSSGRSVAEEAGPRAPESLDAVRLSSTEFRAGCYSMNPPNWREAR